MKKIYFLILLIYSLTLGYSQKLRVYGRVGDEKDSAMIGVLVIAKGDTTGTQTDQNGHYQLEVSPGTHLLDFSYVGYDHRTVPITIYEKEKRLDIKMTDSSQQIDLVIVTGNKYEKKLSEEVVSVEVLKASVIEQSASKMDEAMNKVPGVNMLGKTMSVRGGSGFSDITGNRVMVLLDDLPFISPENGGIIWDMLPIEELEQVELLKGSTSSVYGSSALDGVLNLVTVNPQPQAENSILLNYGLYGQPNNKDWDWWWHRTIVKKNGEKKEVLQRPMFGGGQFTHRKKYGDLGVVVSGAYRQNQNYLQNANYLYGRLGAKLRYTPHKHPQIAVGLNANFFYKSFKDFFVSEDTGKNAYISSSTYTVRQRTFNIDPYITYYDNKNNRQSFKMRIFNVLYNSTSGDSTATTKYYFEYTIQHNFTKADLILTAGADAFYTLSRGFTFGYVIPINPQVYVPHYFNTRDELNAATYVQFDKKFFHKLTLTGGIRFEYARLSDTTIQNTLPLINLVNQAANGKKQINSPISPLGRVGLNYQVAEGTFLRGSLGQGFRYPSLSEKYTYTLRSGAQVFPNPSLLPENGWTTELGIKQGLKVSKWMAYFDLSGFVNRMHNMIEYEYFPAYHAEYPSITTNNLIGFPFQAQNVENARIMGVEFSTVANGKIFGVPLNFLIGYTYTDPRNLDYPKDSGSTPLLKYRIQHSAKADIQFNYKGFVLGLTAFYSSYMKYIDNIGGAGALAVVEEFRALHHEGEFVMDTRIGYNYHDKFSLTFICKNILNTEYMLQPGLIEAPRNFTFQVGYNF